jgi:hypothetical protein
MESTLLDQIELETNSMKLTKNNDFTNRYMH